MAMLIVVGAAAAAFLLGGVPFGLLVSRARGVDIRTVGSGNIGAANVGRALGFRWGAAVFALDMLKGLLATAGAGWVFARIAPMLELSEATRTVCQLGVGMAAVLGHNYTPFLGFRGGKGVATSLGVALGVYPDLTVPALAAFGVWGLCVAMWRISALGSITAAGVFPIAVWVWLAAIRGGVGRRWPLPAFAVLVALLVIVRHRANIARLMRGTEPRLGRGEQVSR